MTPGNNSLTFERNEDSLSDFYRDKIILAFQLASEQAIADAIRYNVPLVYGRADGSVYEKDPHELLRERAEAAKNKEAA